MLDILKMGIMSSVQRSELTVCTVAFPDYCKDDLNAEKEVEKSTNHYSCPCCGRRSSVQ